MYKNVFDMIDGIKVKLDSVNNARLDMISIVDAINESIEAIYEDRYDNFKQRKWYGFQIIQALRDQLSSQIVITAKTAMPSSNLILYPENYKHLLLIQLFPNANHFTKPMAYDNAPKILDDPYAKPWSEDSRHLENASGIELYFDSEEGFTEYQMTYLKKPVLVDIDLNMQTGRLISQSPTATLITGQKYYVGLNQDLDLDTPNTIVYNSVTYSVGDVIVGNGTALSGGLPVGFEPSITKFTDTDMGYNTLRDIVNMSAAFLGGNIEAYKKAQNFGQQEQMN